MKFSFSKDVEYVPEWQGNSELPKKEQFSCKLTTLNMASLMLIADAFSEAGVTGENTTVEPNKMKPILDQIGPLLPKHVEVNGLFDDKGAKITIEEIVEYPVFLGLAIELLMKLSEISSPSDADVKN